MLTFFRLLTSLVDIILRIRKYDKEGKSIRYAAEARIDTSKMKVAVNADDWEITDITHKIFDKLNQEIEHKIKKTNFFSKVQ